MASTGNRNCAKGLKQLAFDKCLLGSASEWSPVLGPESGASKRKGGWHSGPEHIYNLLAGCFTQHGNKVSSPCCANYPELAASLPSPLLGSALSDSKQSYSQRL